MSQICYSFVCFVNILNFSDTLSSSTAESRGRPERNFLRRLKSAVEFSNRFSPSPAHTFPLKLFPTKLQSIKLCKFFPSCRWWTFREIPELFCRCRALSEQLRISREEIDSSSVGWWRRDAVSESGSEVMKNLIANKNFNIYESERHFKVATKILSFISKES